MKKTKKGSPGRPTLEVTEAKLKFAMSRPPMWDLDKVQYAVVQKFGTRLGPRALDQLAKLKRQKKREQRKREQPKAEASA